MKIGRYDQVIEFISIPSGAIKRYNAKVWEATTTEISIPSGAIKS